MSVFVKVIPYIEFLLVLVMLALIGLDYLSLWSNPPGQNQYKSAGKWVLPGLVGLAILAILLLFVVSFAKV